MKLELNYKEKELLINSNIHHLQSANEKIFYNITNEGVLFQFLRKYLKKEIVIEKTRSNKRLFFRSGQLQYKIIIEPILICENEVGFLEKSVIFPYIKRYNLHVTKLAQFLELLDFIETKYELINNYSERSNSVKSYFNSRYKLINDLRLYSVPFIIYGFIFLLTIIFKADILINALIFLTIGSILVYILLLFYIFLRYYKERNGIIEKFSIPEYQLPIRIDETDLLIIKNELSPELLEQLIFECFSKEYNLKVVTEFDHIKSNMESSERNHQNKHEDHEMNSNEIYIEEKFQSKGEKNQIFSKYMSLLED